MRAESPPRSCHVLPLDGLRDPAIRFVSLRDGSGRLLGVGALKTLDPRHGEIKSMRTAPSALGLGAGSAILAHLVSIARTIGFTKLSLETGNSPLFDGANRLYLRDGFKPCGHSADIQTRRSVFYAREI